MIVVDTTVLVYALGTGHPLREPCRAIVAAIGSGGIPATTTVEVIQEFTHVWARRRSRQDAVDRAADYAVLLAPLVRPDVADLRRGLELFANRSSLGAFDAVLAATVLHSPQLSAIVSADGGFSSVPGLTHVDPAAPDVADLLDIGQA